MSSPLVGSSRCPGLTTVHMPQSRAHASKQLRLGDIPPTREAPIIELYFCPSSSLLFSLSFCWQHDSTASRARARLGASACQAREERARRRSRPLSSSLRLLPASNGALSSMTSLSLRLMLRLMLRHDHHHHHHHHHHHLLSNRAVLKNSNSSSSNSLALYRSSDTLRHRHRWASLCLSR